MTEEARRQPILEHLNELRWRLVKSAVALTVGAVVAFFFRDWLFDLLESPYRLAIDNTDALAQFQVTEGFSVAMRLALFGGTLLASPVLLYQIWAFVNPALTPRERKWTVPMVTALAVLFGGGVVFGYIILPRGLEFLLGIQSGLEPIIGVSSYISLALRFLLVFGLALRVSRVLVRGIGRRVGVIGPTRSGTAVGGAGHRRGRRRRHPDRRSAHPSGSFRAAVPVV